MMIKPLVVATLLAAAASVSLGSAWAGATDYAFEPAQVEVKAGPDREIAVRLVHKPGGHAVAGAVIFQTRLDMAPDGMADMTSTIQPVAASEPGLYRFKADLTMAGRWALTLAAKVQGEPETVKATVIFRAKD